jgi:hypothetical protein
LPLSDTTIRTAKPKDKLYRLTDANGLCLEVTPAGSKLWRYRYRFNGNAKMLALGTYPAVTLLKARQMRDESRQMLIDGITQANRRKPPSKRRRWRGSHSKHLHVSGSPITLPAGQKAPPTKPSFILRTI